MFDRDRLFIEKKMTDLAVFQNSRGKMNNLVKLYSNAKIFEGEHGVGKTTKMTQAAMNMQSVFAFIPPTHEIAPIPPFYREKKKTIQILGTESLVWDWNHRDMAGECTHRNCRSQVRFFASKPIGHVFFYDIDEKMWDDKKTALQELSLVIFPFDVSHFILTETTKGYHLWIVDIREQKTSWYSLFRSLKSLYDSDYEFGGQWILRLGEKQDKEPPTFYGFQQNPDCLGKRLSGAHLTLLNKYASMPNIVNHYLEQKQNVQQTFARQVLYHSFDVHGQKIDHRRF